MIYKNTLKNKGSHFIKLYSTCLKRNPEHSRGFTLVETMVAVLILTLTIVSLMSVVANSLFAARYAGDEITATYLLQEAVDYIRNDRDTSVFLQSGNTVTPWADFVAKYSNCTAQKNLTGGCYLDVVSANGGTLPEFGSTNNREFYYHANAADGSYYNYDNTGVITDFTRQILAVPNDAANPNDELDVTVTVSWRNGGLDKSRSLSTTLMRWQ